jgi:uncharacterized protein YacL
LIVEAVRLLVTLACTAIGLSIGRSIPGWIDGTPPDPDPWRFWGALVGAGVGYVLGGMFGRLVDKGLVVAPRAVDRATGPQLFAGAFGVITGVLVGTVLAIPAILMLPPVVGWPVGGLVVLLLAAFGARVFSARAHELLAPGMSIAQRARAAELGADENGYLVDSSAAIDGRLLELARSGLVRGSYWVPTFVVDELQAVADAADLSKRRRGRRGLDILDALGDIPGVGVGVLEDTVPEQNEVDGKLLTLALRLDASLITTDHNLARSAELRGIRVVNPHALAEALRPAVVAGDAVSVRIEKVGSEAGQGIGYLDDGTMVVVAEAAGSVGETVEVEVANMVRTSVGRMDFARLMP